MSNLYLALVVTFGIIKSFGDSETEQIWKGVRSSILLNTIQHGAGRKLRMINNAQNIYDHWVPAVNRMEKLERNIKRYHSIRINEQWQIMFQQKYNNAYAVQNIAYNG